MGQLCAEEKFRRQTQILEECRAELDASLGENKSLVIKQAALQKWTDRLDDDEARQTMAQLYQCLEGWVRRYFPGLSSANKTSNVNPDSLLVDESNRLDIFYGIYDLISNAVFRTYLTRIMVGINDSDFSNKVSMLDRHIRAQCWCHLVNSPTLFFSNKTSGPAHVAQHWRSAMNEATYSLSGESRYSDCKRLAASLDSSYDFYTSMAPDRRIQDLALLLGRFVGLKFRLDSQADLYTFTWKESGTPFNEEEMTCFDGQCAENGVVQYCLSPALYKESKGCGPLLIKKAAVILSLDLQHSSAGEYDSDGAVSAHDVKMGDI
ncbi:hypothetical protein N7486_001125 [Penicillium sp. IBT 16267x]|nr:hypothetical protein N7486_001125 [Penicillium sp. IBT 16267x]